ncbi:hypothetical protein [Methylibium sp. T29]|uniref:hypothetical protein n=1 Tax=Methylibium sp. T29 TaxID=1430884 RepID=UPI000564F30D|nr:hypothetical protein [Methylibium sp. T29]
MQQFHADEFTVAPLGAQVRRPVQAVHFKEHPAAVVHRGAGPQAGHTVERLGGQAVGAHDVDAVRGRLGVGETQVQRAEAVAAVRAGAELAAQLAAVGDVAADAVGPPQQAGDQRHVAGAQRLAHRRAADAQAVHLVAHHPRHVEALAFAGGVEHRVVAGPLRAEAEVVAHQHVARLHAAQQHVVDEGLRRLVGEGLVEAQHDDALHAAARQFAELVAQRGDARRRLGRGAGTRGEEVARMGLEGQHGAEQVAVLGLALEQRQHRLVAAVHAIEVADRDGRRAAIGQQDVVQTSEHLHRRIIATARAGPCRLGSRRKKARSRRAFLNRPGARPAGTVVINGSRCTS